MVDDVVTVSPFTDNLETFIVLGFAVLLEFSPRLTAIRPPT